MKNFLGIFLLFGLTSPLQNTLAQSNPTSAPTSEPSSPTSLPSSSLQSAVDLFNAGDYAKAARLFEAAQAAGIRDPIVWYYLGRCREGMNDTNKAIRAYEQYLNLAPKATDAPAVRLHLEELKANTPQNPSSQPTQQAVDEGDPERPTVEALVYSRQTRLGYAGLALGSMTCLVGLMLGAVSRDRAQLLEDVEPGTLFDETLQDLERQGKAFNKASIITLSSGGALFLGGLAATLTAPKPQQDPYTTSVRLWLSPTPMLGISHSW